MEIRNQNHGEPLMVWALKTASGSVSSHLPLSPRPVQTAGGRLPRTLLCPRGHRLLSLLTLAPIWEPPSRGLQWLKQVVPPPASPEPIQGGADSAFG